MKPRAKQYISASATTLTFTKYQQEVDSTDDSKKLLVSLLGLVGELGDIQTVVKRRLEQHGYPNFERDIAEEIGDTLWYLASLASRLHLSLSAIAADNVRKARDLHSKGKLNRFDRLYPADERLPRQFEVIFEEKALGRGVQVKAKLNHVYVGDALTDNARDRDGYRYHDAFHLAYTAILGWSPVTRALLRRKRKSVPETDEVEDGARAIIVEEAISLFLFNQAKTRNEFRERNAIDISLLKTVKRLAGDLEVRVCTAKQWQEAIFNGYKVFRSLRDNRGGIIVLDLDAATINYLSPKRSAAKGGELAKRTRTRLPKRLAGRRTATRAEPR